jgi:hypothetical protein
MTEKANERDDVRPPRLDGQAVAKHGGTFLGQVLGGMAGKVAVATVVALVAAFVGITKFAHLNPFTPHTTISGTVVLGKLSKIEQVHVATRSYPVDVTITQSIGIIPCFLICNHMELKGNGADDAIVDLAVLSKHDVSIDQAAGSVTIRMAPPAIGPGIVNPATCTISSGHGILNTPTQAFRNDPNGYRPLYVAADSQIHDAAVHDPELLAAGEQSTHELLARVLGAAGVKKVIVDFEG